MLKWLSDLVYKIGYVCCVVLMTIMVSSILIQVFFRYVLNSPLLWPEELTIFSMIWLGFIGASLGVKRGTHVSFNLVLDKLPSTKQKYLKIFIAFSVLAFALPAVIIGIRVLATSKGTSPGLGLSYFWPKLGMIIGFSFILIHAVYFALSSLFNIFEESRYIQKIRIFTG